MGAYDNPQAVRMKIDQGARNITQFFTAMKGVSDSIAKQAAINKKEAEKSEVKQYRALNKFDKDLAHIEGLVDQIGGDFEVGGKDNIQDDAIMENLIAMRTKFLEDIADPDMPASEISRLQAQYENKIAIFKEDMDNFVAGYRIYKDVKDRGVLPGKQDYIFSDDTAPFNEMIPIYDSIYEGKGDVGIYPGADGKSFNIGKFNKTGTDDDVTWSRETENGTVIATSLTEYRKHAQKDGKNNPKFFSQVEEYAPEGGSNTFIQRMIQDFPGGYQYKDGNDVKNINFYTVDVRDKMKLDTRPGSNTYGQQIPVMKTTTKDGIVTVTNTPEKENITLLKPDGFLEILKTPYGQSLIMESLDGARPQEVFASLEPGVAFTNDAFTEAIAQQLQSGYSIVPQ
jgi:hypothetical protein